MFERSPAFEEYFVGMHSGSCSKQSKVLDIIAYLLAPVLDTLLAFLITLAPVNHEQRDQCCKNSCSNHISMSNSP